MVVSILTTTLLTALQSLALRVPAFRSALKIPQYVPQKTGPNPSPLAQFRELLAQARGDDVKTKVSQARRDAAKVRPSVQTPQLK